MFGGHTSQSEGPQSKFGLVRHVTSPPLSPCCCPRTQGPPKRFCGALEFQGCPAELCAGDPAEVFTEELPEPEKRAVPSAQTIRLPPLSQLVFHFGACFVNLQRSPWMFRSFEQVSYSTCLWKGFTLKSTDRQKQTVWTSSIPGSL